MRQPVIGAIRPSAASVIVLLLLVALLAGCDGRSASNDAPASAGGDGSHAANEAAGAADSGGSSTSKEIAGTSGDTSGTAALGTPAGSTPTAPGPSSPASEGDDWERDGKTTAASGQVAFGRFAPFFRAPMTAEAPGNPDAWMYDSGGAVYNLKSKRSGWLGVDSAFGTAWVPDWYAKNGGTGREIALRQASRISPAPGAQLHLTPDSATAWPADEWTGLWNGRSDGPIAVLEWEDWYGVVIPPSTDYDDFLMIRPALLWIRKSDAGEAVPLADGGLMRSGGLPFDTVRLIAEVALQPGIGADRVRSLLGEPDKRETSRNLNETDQPMRLGTDWRYERSDGQLVATVSEKETLERMLWIMPFASPAQAQISPFQYPASDYRFSRLPLAVTGGDAADWRAQSELPLNFLYAATDDTLLLFADDGGFSGMHADSKLMAVNRQTGKKLWQIDGGYDEIGAVTDKGGAYATVYTRYDPAAGAEKQLLRRVRLSDGKTVWQTTIPRDAGQEATHMTGANDAVITYRQPFERTNGMMSVWNAATGRLKWSKSFDRPFAVLSRGDRDSYVLLQQDNTLEAFDPDSGRSIWKVKAEGDAPDGYDSGPAAQAAVEPAADPFAEPEPRRWFALGNERILVDTDSGKVVSRYPVKPVGDEDIEVIDNRYWLVRKPLDADRYWNAARFESSLYDAIAGKTVWTVPGRAAGAAMDGDDETVYLLLDHVPTALRVSDGKELWAIKLSAPGGNADGAAGVVDKPAADGTNGNADASANSGAAGSGQPRNDLNGIFYNEGELLLLSNGDDLLAVDRSAGRILFRLADIKLSYPDSLVSLTRSGIVNQDGRYLYVSSSDGRFYRLDKSKLQAEAG